MYILVSMSEFLTPQGGKWKHRLFPGRTPSSMRQSVGTPPRHVTGAFTIVTKKMRRDNNMTSLEVLASVFGEQLAKWAYGPSGVDPITGLSGLVSIMKTILSPPWVAPPYERYNTLIRMETGDIQIFGIDTDNPLLYGQSEDTKDGLTVTVADGKGGTSSTSDCFHAVVVIKASDTVAWMYDNWGSDASWQHYLVHRPAPVRGKPDPEGVRFVTSTELDRQLLEAGYLVRSRKPRTVYVNDPRFGLTALLERINGDDPDIVELFPHRGDQRLSLVSRQVGMFCNEVTEAPCQLFVNLMHEYSFPLTGVSADYAYRYVPRDPADDEQMERRDFIRTARPHAWKVGRDRHDVNDGVVAPRAMVDTFEAHTWARQGFQLGWTFWKTGPGGTLQRVTADDIARLYHESDSLLRDIPATGAGGVRLRPATGAGGGRVRPAKRKLFGPTGTDVDDDDA